MDAWQETLIQLLENDLLEQLRALLKKCGYQLDNIHVSRAGNSTTHQALMVAELYYDKRSHRLQPRKRKVLTSTVLNDKLQNPGLHGVSSSDIQAIQEILQNSVEGKDLSIHYGKRVGKLSTNYEKQDRLFNDWNIHHLHLGTLRKQPNSGLMNRSKNVLFVYPTDDHAHLLFLDIRSHDPNDPEPWYDKKLIEIIHAEWPAFVADYIAKGVVGVYGQTTESSVKLFRGESKEHKLAAKQIGAPFTPAFITFLQMDDGTVYHPFGNGLAMNGMRGTDVDRSCRLMQNVADWVRGNNEEQVRKSIYHKYRMAVSIPKIRLRVVGKTLWDCKVEIFEEKSSLVLAERPL